MPSYPVCHFISRNRSRKTIDRRPIESIVGTMVYSMGYFPHETFEQIFSIAAIRTARTTFPAMSQGLVIGTIHEITVRTCRCTKKSRTSSFIQPFSNELYVELTRFVEAKSEGIITRSSSTKILISFDDDLWDFSGHRLKCDGVLDIEMADRESRHYLWNRSFSKSCISACRFFARINSSSSCLLNRWAVCSCCSSPKHIGFICLYSFCNCVCWLCKSWNSSVTVYSRNMPDAMLVEESVVYLFRLCQVIDFDFCGPQFLS